MRVVLFLAVSLLSTGWGTDTKERVNAMWLDFSGQMLSGMATRWRDDDIVISVPGKSGTTWTMNIVHQLRTGGDDKFLDLYEEVPWLEFFETPYITPQDLYDRWDALPYWFPRAFKTHAAPPKTPFDPRVRYVVVVRDPRDALASFLPFMHKHTDALIDYFAVPPEMVEGMLRPKTHYPLFEGFAFKGKLFTDFLEGWYTYRNHKNVLILHYSDMIKNHVGTIKKIHDFLGFKLSLEQLARVHEFTSFEYMKKHGEKFTLPRIGARAMGAPFIERDGMVRSGKVGTFNAELPEDIKKGLEATFAQELSPKLATWLMQGGALPEDEKIEL